MKRFTGKKEATKFYFFRFGFLSANFLADLDEGGGGVFNIFRNASSKPSPFVVMPADLGMKSLNHNNPKFPMIFYTENNSWRGGAK
jgi:hypothetical protein